MSNRTLSRPIVAVVAGVALLTGAGGIWSSAQNARAADIATPASNQTVKKSFWGETEVNGRSLFPTYRDLGMGLHQAEIRWDRVAKAKPADPTDPNDLAYAWPADLVSSVDEAGAYGMETSIRIMGAPAWSNGGHSPRWIPTDKADFAKFAVAASKKFPSVHEWMVWGEPNREANFAPLTPSKIKGPLTKAQQVAPRNYAELLDTAYGWLKSASPENKVIGGNTFTSAGANVIYPYQWIRYMRLPDGSRPRMDMYGHNPFGYRKPDLHRPPSPKGRVDFCDLGRFAKALDRNFPGTHLPLFLSEWGVQSGGSRNGPGYKVSPKTQAAWIRAAYGIARRWNRIYTLGWVHTLDTPISPAGLMDSAGNPKPGYYVFQSS